jgi:hypothetical protein
VRLTDFGIARMCTVEQPGSDPKIIGTPQYMSPEQCAGEDVAHSTDLFSLGVTLYQMIAGKLPFKAESPQALMRLIASQTESRLNRIVPDVPDDVARLVAHLLEKGPGKRPASAREVSQTIERLQVEDGGRSAIPQALAAYVREQAHDSPLRVLTPPPTKEKSKPTQPDFPRTSNWDRRILTGAAFAVAALACATVASTWLAFRGAPAAAPAPEIDSCTYTKQPDGTLLAALPANDFRANRIGWAGRERALLVEAVGQPTSMARGATGILAILPDRQECLSVASPAGASLAVGAASAEAVPLALGSGIRWTDAIPAILLGQRTASDERKISGLVYVQRWNEAAPALNPAAAFASAGYSGADALEANARCVQAVLRPDGGAICMVIEREDGTNCLAEQRVYGSSPIDTLTENGPRIVSESVQYTPSGDRVIFVRQDKRAKQELWSTPTNGGASTLLAIGYFNGEASISPSGDRVAAAWSAAPGAAAELRILSASDGTTLQRLGDATVGHDAWLPTGNGLVAAARDTNGLRQLCLKDPANPRDSRTLTALDSGVGNATAVSADGAWAAGIADGEAGIRVVFVDLAHLPATRIASQSAHAKTEQGAG